jgi:flavorubredoxin
MTKVEVTPNVYWVGAIDWAVRDFHGYVTPRGSTYNNYLIMDDEPALVDAVHGEFTDTSIKNIRAITKMRDIKHVIVNHIEPDHAGGLYRMVHMCGNPRVYITKKGLEGLGRMFDISGWDIKVVKTGDEVKTGKKTLMFLETPMLHWPDSMMTYVKEDKLLISQDAFGQHMATTQRFDDELLACTAISELDDAVWDYYANILMPFGTLIKSKLGEVAKLGIEIDIIAPDHGVIWRQNPGKVLGMYSDMAEGKCDERVSIIYDTMWHSTEKMIEPIAKGIKAEGMDCKVLKIRATPTSTCVKEFWRSRGTLIGSPTLNNTLFPPIGDFLVNLKGLRPKGRLVSAFGSYGWGGGAVRDIIKQCQELKLEVMEPGVQVKYKATPEEEEQLFEFGREFAIRTREYHKTF